MFTPLFTDGVWNTTFNSDLKDYCDFIRKNDTGRNVSNILGYQSNNLNMADPVLQPLISHITSSTKDYSKHIGIETSGIIDNMWINISGHKDYNIEHIHSGCLISGVYYVQTPRDCGDIVFLRHSHDYMLYDWRNVQKDFNTHNSARFILPSEKNKCYLFPSYYKHAVAPNRNQSERYSISFNLR